MIEIDSSWLASTAGVLALVEITMRLFKNMIKQSGDIYVNLVTILSSLVYSTLAFSFLDRLTVSQLYPLIGQVVIVSGVATLGYEVIKNILSIKQA